MQMDHTYQTNQELQVKRDSTLMMEWAMTTTIKAAIEPLSLMEI
jgi:hypothetical protein